MSAEVIPLPNRASSMHEFLFGESSLLLKRWRAQAHSMDDLAIADAVESLALARARFSDAAAELSAALLSFADALDAQIGGCSK